MYAEVSIMQFNSSPLLLDFLAYTKMSYIPKDCSPKEFSQITSVAKQWTLSSSPAVLKMLIEN